MADMLMMFLSAKPTSSSDFRCLMPESRGYACAEYLNGDIYLFEVQMKTDV